MSRRSAELATKRETCVALARPWLALVLTVAAAVPVAAGSSSRAGVAAT